MVETDNGGNGNYSPRCRFKIVVIPLSSFSGGDFPSFLAFSASAMRFAHRCNASPLRSSIFFIVSVITYHDPSGRKPLTLVKGGMPSFLPTDNLIIH